MEHYVTVSLHGLTFTAYVCLESKRVHIYCNGKSLGSGVWSCSQVVGDVGKVPMMALSMLNKAIEEA